MKDPCSIKELADELSISKDTLSNWIRTGAFEIFQNKDSLFPMNEQNKKRFLEELRRSGKLQSRANRVHFEGKLTNLQKDLAHWSKDYTIEELLRVFIQRWNLEEPQHHEIFQEELELHWPKIDGSIADKLFNKILLDCPEDPLGHLLQLLQPGSLRIKNGSFFTPIDICHRMFQNYSDLSQKTFFDPSAGSGRFILGFLKAGGNPRNIWAMEKDPLSYKIARLNFRLWVPEFNSEPPIYLGDSLKDPLIFLPKQGVDLMISNPPWATIKSYKKKDFPQREYWASDYAGLFMALAKERLSPNGNLGFLLPQSIMSQKYHGLLRKQLLIHVSIYKVELLNQCFPGIQSWVMAIYWTKKKHSKAYEVTIDGHRFSKAQPSRKENTQAPWNLYMDSLDTELWDKMIEIASRQLKNSNAQWIMGVVTGNNKKYISSQKSTDSPEILLGKDIFQGRISHTKNWLIGNFNNLQQKAPLKLYSSSCKLVYRFIAPKPLAALDFQGRIMLNSANGLLLPSLKEMIFLCYLLNSPLYGYIYMKKFHSVKILRSHLEEFPFPELNENLEKELHPILTMDYSDQNSNDFNKWLYRFFQLTPKEVKRIESEETHSFTG
ncbi:MAG: N-6 DNA methylase [Spirochaetaceae bacterium]|nr:N-6 DNA methylase [Spirochaetaceae bacterium]